MLEPLLDVQASFRVSFVFGKVLQVPGHVVRPWRRFGEDWGCAEGDDGGRKGEQAWQMHSVNVGEEFGT
jgi:hypothetical protein